MVEPSEARERSGGWETRWQQDPAQEPRPNEIRHCGRNQVATPVSGGPSHARRCGCMAISGGRSGGAASQAGWAGCYSRAASNPRQVLERLSDGAANAATDLTGAARRSVPVCLAPFMATIWWADAGWSFKRARRHLRNGTSPHGERLIPENAAGKTHDCQWRHGWQNRETGGSAGGEAEIPSDFAGSCEGGRFYSPRTVGRPESATSPGSRSAGSYDPTYPAQSSVLPDHLAAAARRSRS